jgi:P-type E1-E2 ATPase
MIELNIPGRGTIRLEHLVCDINGTLTVDSRLIDGVAKTMGLLRDRLEIHLLTADTYGKAALVEQRLGLNAVRLRIEPNQSQGEAEQKAAFIQQIGPERVVAIGQGANDQLMLKAANIGICVISPEGTAVETLLAADVTAPDILSALELLEKPLRLVATLRK